VKHLAMKRSATALPMYKAITNEQSLTRKDEAIHIMKEEREESKRLFGVVRNRAMIAVFDCICITLEYTNVLLSIY
jgi:hypothetical protein